LDATLYVNKKIVLDMYEKIFKNLNEHKIDIFLCGGSGSDSNQYVRDSIRDILSKNLNFRILYPEDLFIELLNKNKGYDLLSLEKFLADNCDEICIICESSGALVELGAFTNNEATFNKVIAAIKTSRKKDKSFIMLGPVRLLEKSDKDRVIFYEDSQELSRNLLSYFKKKYKHSRFKNTRGIDTIIGLYYYILINIYFYKTLEIKKVIAHIQCVYTYLGLENRNFDMLFTTSLRLLHKDKFIHKITQNKQTYYSLTPKGYERTNTILRGFNTKSRDAIKFAIIKDEFY
jgi:hypothetical protein